MSDAPRSWMPAVIGLALVAVVAVAIVLAPWEDERDARVDGGPADEAQIEDMHSPDPAPASPTTPEEEAPDSADSTGAPIARQDVVGATSARSLRIAARSQGSYYRARDVSAWAMPAGILDTEAVRQSLREERRLPDAVLADAAPLHRSDGRYLTATLAHDETFVYATAKDESGWRILTAEDAGAALDLHLSSTDALPVAVVDHAGEPAIGARVTFATKDPGNRFASMMRRRAFWPVASRAPDGIAYLPLPEVREFAERGAFDEDVLTVESANLHEKVVVEIPDFAAPATTPTLHLPPTGTLEIHADDPTLAGTLDVTAATKTGRRRLHDVPMTAGVAVLQHVGVRVPLHLELSLDGETGTRPYDVLGPAPAGGASIARIEVERVFTLTGTLLDEQGAPVTLKRGTPRDLIAFRVNQGRMLAGDGPVLAMHRGLDVDGRGRFRVVLADAREGDVLCGSHLRVDDARAAWVGTQTVDARTLDLGTLRLGTGPLLVAGRVVNALGEPLRGAQVWAFDRHPLDRAAQTTTGQAPSKEVMDSWTAYVQACSTTTDHEGRFRLLQGPHMPDPHLVAQTELHRLEDPVPFQVGDDDVRIVVSGPGAIEVPWVGPAGLPEMSVDLTVRDAAGRIVSKSSLPPYMLGSGGGLEEDRERSGVARERDLPGGIYSVTLTVRGFDQRPVHALGPIEVRPDETVRTSRVDLRDVLHVIPVEAVDESGARIEPLDFAIIGEAGTHAITRWSGKSAITAPLDATFGLAVGSPGYAPALVDEVGDRVRVTLHRGIRTTLRMLTDVPREDPEIHPGLEWSTYIAEVREEPPSTSQEIPRSLSHPTFVRDAAPGPMEVPNRDLMSDAPRRFEIGAAGPCAFRVDVHGRCRLHVHVWTVEVRLTAADDGGVIVLETPPHIRELWE